MMSLNDAQNEDIIFQLILKDLQDIRQWLNIRKPQSANKIPSIEINEENQQRLLQSILSPFDTNDDAKNIIPAINMIQKFAKESIKDEQILSSLNGNCYYFPSFFNDYNYTIYNSLKYDLSKQSHLMLNLGQRLNCLMFDNGDGFKGNKRRYKDEISITFTLIMDILSKYFECDFIDGVLNHYLDSNDHIPFHNDYYHAGIDMTVGISFGCHRTLAFWNEEKDEKFQVPSMNGDIFAFTKTINDTFKHSIPKELDKQCGPRFSMILLGKRRILNKRNSSFEERNALNIP